MFTFTSAQLDAWLAMYLWPLTRVAAVLAGYAPGTRELDFDPAGGPVEVELVLEPNTEPARPTGGADETLPR